MTRARDARADDGLARVVDDPPMTPCQLVRRDIIGESACHRAASARRRASYLSLLLLIGEHRKKARAPKRRAAVGSCMKGDMSALGLIIIYALWRAAVVVAKSWLWRNQRWPAAGIAEVLIMLLRRKLSSFMRMLLRKIKRNRYAAKIPPMHLASCLSIIIFFYMCALHAAGVKRPLGTS